MPRLNSGSCPTSWKFDDAAEPAAGAAGDPAAGAAATIAGSHIMAKTLTKTSGRRIPIPSLTGTVPGRKRPQSCQCDLSSAWAGVNPTGTGELRIHVTGVTAEIGHQRLADIDRQRQYVLPAALAANEQLAVTPVNVIEPEPGDLACAQPEPRQHQQDRSAHTRSRAPVTLRLGHSRARNKLTSAAHNRPRPSPPRPSRPARNSRAAGPYKTRTVCADSPRSIRKYRR